MGKFSDTKYANTIDNLVSATKDKLNNPYYKFSDKKPTKVIYYSQNIEKSTLDEASGLYGAHIGTDSPFKFNRINDFLLYGIDKININYDLGEFGLSSDKIMGDCIVLPNTITPRPGDFFSICYIKEDILFKVTEVNYDTLDTGANIYTIGYKLSKIDNSCIIQDQVCETYDFMVNNIGTDFNTIIRNSDHKLIDNIEGLVENLIIRFNNIFFNPKLQTFIINHDGWLMYDPSAIEFIIRNNILNFGDEYTHVSHAMHTNRTFGMDYLKTFFYCLEHPDQEINCQNIVTADLITDPNSLFTTRLERYFWIRYCDTTPYKTRFSTIDRDVIDHIINNDMYEKGNKNELYNLWIAYFNNDKDYIKGDLIEGLNNIEFMNSLDYFYALLITIFVLERYLYSLVKK